MNQCNRKSIMFLLYFIYIHIKKLLFFLFNLKSTSISIKTTSKSKSIKRKSVISNASSISSSSSSSSSSTVDSIDEGTDIKSISQSKTNTENISDKNNSSSVNTNIKELNNNNNKSNSADTTVNNTVTNKNIDTKSTKDNKGCTIEQTLSKEKTKKSVIERKKVEIESTNSTDNESKQICRIKRSPSVSVRRKRKEKKVLVLDLDETLIHSTSRGSRNHDYMIEVLLDKHICLYYVYKRPYVDSFLKKVSEWYKVVVFTASLKEYADPVIDYLDPEKKIFSKRYFREVCLKNTRMKTIYI